MVSHDKIIKHCSESCPSGLRSWSWKPVIPKGTVGSNPTLSALMSWLQFLNKIVFANLAIWRNTQAAEGAPLERE